MVSVEAIPTTDTVTPIDSIAPVADTIAQQKIPTTVILGSGDYLVHYTHRYFDHSEYWAYIYLTNKERIRDPDNVPLGTKIKIPLPQGVGITDNRETDLVTARRLIHDYYSTITKN